MRWQRSSATTPHSKACSQETTAAQDSTNSAWAKSLTSLVTSRSAVRLSIGEAMSAAFRERYGCEFVPVANGIEPAEWSGLEPAAKADGPFVIRYCGGLTDDMTTASVEAFARVVGELGAELPVRFEIYALPAALKTAQERFREFPGVTVLPSVAWADYPRLLATADAALIAYNFDERTRTYTQYSMANKLPECLASGAPLIVFGPETIATVRRARELGAAVMVTNDDATELKAAVRRLALEPKTFREAAARARTRALGELSVEAERRKFQAAVLHLDRARPSRIESRTLLGPYTRLQRRGIDACTVAARFFSTVASAKVAVAIGDIGRDHLEKFVEQEWTVIACADLAAAERHFVSLAPTFGKNAVAVVLCGAGDYARLRPLPIRTVATLVFHAGGANAVRMASPAFPEARMVWSESYPVLAGGVAQDFRMLREICDPAELPPDRPGVVMVIDPSVLRVRRGAGDAVVQIRKAYAAALDTAAAKAAGERGDHAVGGRILACLRAWGAAILRLNVRFQVTRFFRERFAEAWEIVQPSRRGRLLIWK